MFYFEQDVKNENLTEVFEDLQDSTQENTQPEESTDGTVDLNELAQGGEQ